MNRTFIWIAILILLALAGWWVCKKTKGPDLPVVPVIHIVPGDTLVALDESDSLYVDIPEIERPPFEVFFLDQVDRPQDNGTRGKTYTATVYILDNTAKKLNGPYLGSTFPNSISNTNNKTTSNTAKQNDDVTTVYVFNNQSGHKGGTIKGLNLIDQNNERYTPGFKPDSTDVRMKYVNVHTGQSDNGNYNSRGSRGCMTLLPSDTTAFFGNFNFDGGTTGTSSGVISIIRTTQTTIDQIIKDLKNVYP